MNKMEADSLVVGHLKEEDNLTKIEAIHAMGAGVEIHQETGGTAVETIKTLREAERDQTAVEEGEILFLSKTEEGTVHLDQVGVLK